MTPQTPRLSTHSNDAPSPGPSTDAGNAIRCIAFVDDRRHAQGSPLDVALALKELVERQPPGRVLVFDSTTSRPVELDLRGPEDLLRRRYASSALESPLGECPPAENDLGSQEDDLATARRRGRPKLGVIGREVTLLPRHWEWLQRQPGGASVTLRKLVDRARKTQAGEDRKRTAQDSAYRFMVAIAGDRPGFEEATRALFAGDGAKLQHETTDWPGDVRQHLLDLAQPALAPSGGEDTACTT